MKFSRCSVNDDIFLVCVYDSFDYNFLTEIFKRLLLNKASKVHFYSFSRNFFFSESTLHLVLRLRGGGKKRKKKNYTTPKKIKHKHKKVKLSVLKYYRVDDNGKIHRLRRECPAEECGAGIFMAAHADRQYCGKCGLTYMFNAMDEK